MKRKPPMNRTPPEGVFEGKLVHCLGCDLAYVPDTPEGPAWVYFNGGINGYEHTSRVHDNPLCKLSFVLKTTETEGDGDPLAESMANAINEEMFIELLAYELNKDI